MRTRPRSRLLLAILLFAVMPFALGFVTTTAVAFACAANQNFSSMTEPMETLDWPTAAPPTWPAPTQLGVHSPKGLGVAVRFAQHTSALGTLSQITRLAGWPFFAFHSTTSRCDLADRGLSVEAYRAPPPRTWIIPDRFTPDPYMREMPLRVMWSGALADSALFAAPWCLLVLALANARPFIRRLRGQCPGCGYAMMKSTTCPECGRVRRTSTNGP